MTIDGEDYRARDMRASSEPAPTVTEKARSWTVSGCGDPLRLKGDDWPERRPAKTIAGDSRVFQPGGHHAPGEQSSNSIRIDPEEAAILQGFPIGHPFCGSRSKQFEQIGNAVPPPLARAVLAALIGSPSA